ncbi:HEPN domain-containing protein [Streptomyces sp. NPDC057020]|uniref:ApeA N-terminal domain 1-containing protein n=1 Tax=unclassified Streptomyces TaxID=2593676 RepID=UPI003632FCB7
MSADRAVPKFAGADMAQDKQSDSVVSDWWLPEDGEEAAAPGTYSVLQTGNAKAVLHRPMGTSSALEFNPTTYPLVHGVAFGKPVTLVDARAGRARLGMGTQAEIELLPRLAIEGLLLTEDELSVTEVKVRIQRQDDWVRPRSFNVERDSGGFPTRVSMKQIPDLLAWANNALIGVCDFTTTRGNGGAEFAVHSRSGFRLCFNTPIPVGELFDGFLRGLQVLMTLITGTRCGIESLEFTNDTWKIDGCTPKHPHWVKVRMRAPEIDSKKSNHRRFLFPFGAMDWESQASRIMDLSSEWVYAIEQWALLLDDRFVWPVARFATAASAVEALDRVLNPTETYEPDTDLINRVAEALRETQLTAKDRKKVKGALKRPKETSLEERIRRLAALAPDAMKLVVNEPQWESRVARLRHVVSHGLKSSESFSKDVRTVQCGTEILLNLLECTFLFHLGFSCDQITAIKVRHSDTEWRKQIVDECFSLMPQIPGQEASSSPEPKSSTPAGNSTSPVSTNDGKNAGIATGKDT